MPDVDGFPPENVHDQLSISTPLPVKRTVSPGQIITDEAEMLAIGIPIALVYQLSLPSN